MDMFFNVALPGIILAIFVGSGLFALGYAKCQFKWEKELVKRGYAQYNSKTGAWEWIEFKSE